MSQIGSNVGSNVEKKVFQSTHIAHAEYNSIQKSLTIRYHNGSTYTSTNPVHGATWDAFKKAPSAGQFYRNNIHPKWGGTKVT